MGIIPLPKSVKQKADHLCGPACLESLLGFYGVQAAQEELATLCGTSEADGTPPEHLARGLSALGFSMQERTGATWEELRALTEQGTPVLVGWFTDFEEPGDEHYSIAYNVTDTDIYMMDPEIGGERVLPKEDFLRRWAITEPFNWYVTIAPIEKQMEE